MTLATDSVRARALRLIERVRRVRLALAAAVAAFASLAAAGALSPTVALAGFAFIALALLIGASASAPLPGLVRGGEGPARPGDRLLETVLAGLPDPVVALDRNGEVGALHARASTIVPALRRGGPLSRALR